MVKVPIALAAAALCAGMLSAVSASATLLSSGPLPVLDQPSTSNVEPAAMRRPFIPPNRFGNARSFRFQNRFGNAQSFRFRNRFVDNRRFAFRHRFIGNRRFAFRHRFVDGFNGTTFAFGVAPGYIGPGYGYDYDYEAYGAPVAGGHVQYCLSRYRSYDPATDTFMGYDGLRHPCIGPY